MRDNSVDEVISLVKMMVISHYDELSHKADLIENEKIALEIYDILETDEIKENQIIEAFENLCRKYNLVVKNKRI